MCIRDSSESGFYAFDTALNYQYKAFGVSRIGLKRELNLSLIHILVSFLPDAMQVIGDVLEIRPDSAFAYDLLSERENVQALETAYKAATRCV